MRILIAAKHAPCGRRPIGGVQSWCRTVAGELRKRSHEVILWGPELPLIHDQFDYGIIANISSTKKAAEQCRKHLTVCHGIIPAETPPTEHVAFTSEQVRDHWDGNGPIIRQPIDLDFWSPVQPDRKYLTRFSYRGGLPFLPTLAKTLGLLPHHIRNANPEGSRHIVRQSACVLATGRAALEAMACGIPVVICDHRSSYQKPLFDPDTTGAMVRNYSGRGGIRPTIDNIEWAVRKAMKTGSLRDHVEKHHNVENIADQLLLEAA